MLRGRALLTLSAVAAVCFFFAFGLSIFVLGGVAGRYITHYVLETDLTALPVRKWIGGWMSFGVSAPGGK